LQVAAKKNILGIDYDTRGGVDATATAELELGATARATLS